MPAKVADEASALVVRAAREALTNVKKHARASEVRVTLSRIGDLVALDVTDDGVGFDPEVRPAAGAGFGLVALRERARALGGELAVESELGKRTTICLHVPSAGKGEP